MDSNILKYGDHINTDLINPAWVMELPLREQVLHAMEGVDPDFSSRVKKGDILVAGRNFGSGSSRETAALVLKESGISAILAESFARIFYRNAINIGLPVLICPGISKVDNSAFLQVDYRSGIVEDIRNRVLFRCEPIPPLLEEILRCGGLIPYTVRQLQQAR